jgi:hypothetical protein
MPGRGFRGNQLTSSLSGLPVLFNGQIVELFIVYNKLRRFARPLPETAKFQQTARFKQLSGLLNRGKCDS